MAASRTLTELDPLRTRQALRFGTNRRETWEAASLATGLVNGEPVPRWIYVRAEDTGTTWHVTRFDWAPTRFELFTKLSDAQDWTYRQDEAHVAETFTPEDDRIIVDCSCGQSYLVAVPGTSLDYRVANEGPLLVEAHAKHERKCRA
jgi:hypothetical protein